MYTYHVLLYMYPYVSDMYLTLDTHDTCIPYVSYYVSDMYLTLDTHNTCIPYVSYHVHREEWRECPRRGTASPTFDDCVQWYVEGVAHERQASGDGLGSRCMGTSVRARRSEGGAASDSGCIGGGGRCGFGGGCNTSTRASDPGRRSSPARFHQPAARADASGRPLLNE